MKSKIKYFASSKDIAFMGPYDSEVEAWSRLMMCNGLPIDGAKVWPSEDTFAQLHSKFISFNSKKKSNY